MLFDLFKHCKESHTPEAVVQRYLKKKYNKEFTVEAVTRKENGPFKTEYYSGFAYEIDRPLERFKVWVEENLKTVHDAYYCVYMLPSIVDFVQAKAEDEWNDVKAYVRLETLMYNDHPDYDVKDIQRFYSNESLISYTFLFLPRQDVTDESMKRFIGLLKGTITGTVHVFYTDRDQIDRIDLMDCLYKTPDRGYSIR